MNPLMEATTGLIPTAVREVYRVVHACATHVVERGERHGPMLVSVGLNGNLRASLLDDLPSDHWRGTLLDVAMQRGVLMACLISEASVRQVLPGGADKQAIIFSFLEGERKQEYMAICEIDRARPALTMGQLDPVIRDW